MVFTAVLQVGPTFFLHCVPKAPCLLASFRRRQWASFHWGVRVCTSGPKWSSCENFHCRKDGRKESNVVEYEMGMILVFTSSWCNLEEGRFIYDFWLIQGYSCEFKISIIPAPFSVLQVPSRISQCLRRLMYKIELSQWHQPKLLASYANRAIS